MNICLLVLTNIRCDLLTRHKSRCMTNIRTMWYNVLTGGVNICVLVVTNIKYNVVTGGVNICVLVVTNIRYDLVTGAVNSVHRSETFFGLLCERLEVTVAIIQERKC